MYSYAMQPKPFWTFSLAQVEGWSPLVCKTPSSPRLAFHESTGAAEGYLEFHISDLNQQSHGTTNFKHNDGDQSAASAFRNDAANPTFRVISGSASAFRNDAANPTFRVISGSAKLKLLA